MQQFASVQCIRHFQYNFKIEKKKLVQSIQQNNHYNWTIDPTKQSIQQNNQYNKTIVTPEKSIQDEVADIVLWSTFTSSRYHKYHIAFKTNFLIYCLKCRFTPNYSNWLLWQKKLLPALKRLLLNRFPSHRYQMLQLQ